MHVPSRAPFPRDQAGVFQQVLAQQKRDRDVDANKWRRAMLVEMEKSRQADVLAARERMKGDHTYAATRLQAAARGRAGRKAYAGAKLKRHESAVAVQSLVRGRAQQRRFRSDKAKLDVGAVALQARPVSQSTDRLCS